MLASAHTAFETHRRAFCGNMIFEKLDLSNEQPYTSVDFEGELVTLAPPESANGGIFDQTFIHFYFDDYPDRQLNI